MARITGAVDSLGIAEHHLREAIDALHVAERETVRLVIIYRNGGIVLMDEAQFSNFGSYQRS